MRAMHQSTSSSAGIRISASRFSGRQPASLRPRAIQLAQRLEPIAAPAATGVGLEPVPCRHSCRSSPGTLSDADADLVVRACWHFAHVQTVLAIGSGGSPASPALSASPCWCIGAVRPAHPQDLILRRHRDPAHALSAAYAWARHDPRVARHLDGHEMVKFMNWAQGILTCSREPRRLLPT